MDILIQLAAFIITILVLVSFHEAGHFTVAKLLGVKVLRFAVGFGKPIYRLHDKSGTEYVIGFIPLGGYVKLLDEREVEVPEKEKHLAFNRQPLWARTLVVLAGPFTNLLFALLAFWLMYMIGIESLRPIIGKVIPHSIAATAGIRPFDQIKQVDGKPTPSLQKVFLAITKRLGETSRLIVVTENPTTKEKTEHVLNLKHWSIDSLNPDPLESLGLKPYQPPLPAVIDEVNEHSPAQQAGLKANDKITQINGQPVEDWYAFVRFIHLHPGAKISVTFTREGIEKQTQLTIDKQVSLNFRTTGYIGVKPKITQMPESMKLLRRYPAGEAFKFAADDTWEYFAFNFIVLKKLVLGQISLNTLGGPIAIFRTADLALRQGVAVFLGFLALISVMLAFINILPIPGLDGGHLLNYLIEFIIRRPLPLSYEVLSIRIGMILLILLMMVATVNDLLRLFSS